MTKPKPIEEMFPCEKGAHVGANILARFRVFWSGPTMNMCADCAREFQKVEEALGQECDCVPFWLENERP